MAATLRRALGSPALRILVLAPFFGEGLSGSSPPLDLLMPGRLAFMMALYGCGALVCRDIAHRFRLGLPGLILLGVAYAIWEEGLVDRYWFLPAFWTDSGIGSYSVVGHTNLLLAAHLTVFHTTISIGAAILVVEALVPRARDRPWASRPALGLTGLTLAATPLIYGEFAQRPPAAVLVATGALLIAVIALAFPVGRRRPGAPPAAAGHSPRRRTPTRRDDGSRPRGRLGAIAFTGAAAHWILTYAVPGTGLPWPLGLSLALLPVVVAALLLARLATTGPYGADGLRVIIGLLTFFALLDLLVAALGRYDMLLSAALAAWLARHLHHRQAAGHPGPPRGVSSVTSGCESTGMGPDVHRRQRPGSGGARLQRDDGEPAGG
ncbi:hypothetical protein ACWT_4741 [Actinoplanes sp. SE50]|uniref:hypothetical protein n=1 Tax=unclassified Actinoplanes TaxID=2626549 RepID=UPI00023EBF66|nr:MULTISPECIES: hypothetical protein [unclassified Actinoplanes]AEV85763.1 hypothetical protein ACPL_4872 [Actinoplanes sp. SE50/110]ATO84156.1 hypothetical protein ACWT_4741 [Actinoplanes sp. SE50]SLM01566.1 hypothetical protein ACSP50_4802 [Actinoplanes sp. SE50/110]